MTHVATRVATRVAPLELHATDQGLQRVRFLPGDPPIPREGTVPPMLEPAVKAVRAYLAGDLDAFRDVELDVEGTAFQRSVWTTLRTIPAGETRTYSEVARAVDRPRAARAVGQAVGANPVPLAVPCHRVLPKGGGLGGWSGDVPCKGTLLEHEGVRVPAAP